MPNFFGLGVTAGSFAERVAMVSPSVGLLFYQSDTDEFLKFCVDDDGVSRWMQAELRPARNLLINGSMGVWQRGSSVNAGGSGISTYAQDRWCFGNNSASAYNMSRVTNVPSSRFLYSGRLTANVASPAALNGWEQFVEQRNMLFARGKYVTLSFWIRGSKSFSGACYVDTGTTADQMPGNGNAFTGGVTLVSQTVNITTSWQKVVFTSSVVVPTNANVLRVGLPKPSFVQNDWYEVTGVQFEIGTAHSEFEFLPYERELMSCMRYYENSTSGVNAPSANWLENAFGHTQPFNGSYCFINANFKVTKRRLPDCVNHSYNGSANAFSNWNDGNNYAIGSVSCQRFSAGGIGILYNSANNFNTGSAVWHGWVANAELT